MWYYKQKKKTPANHLQSSFKESHIQILPSKQVYFKILQSHLNLLRDFMKFVVYSQLYLKIQRNSAFLQSKDLEKYTWRISLRNRLMILCDSTAMQQFRLFQSLRIRENWMKLDDPIL